MGSLLRVVLVGALALSGCADYRPLYGTTNQGATAVTKLAEISVEPQTTRAGQMLRNNLLEGMGSSPSPRYVLRLSITEHANTVSALSVNLPSRMRYSIAVDYSLIDQSAGHTSLSGKSFSNVSYDSLNQPVSDMAAANDAMARATRDSAQDIRQRLAAYFASGKS